MRALIGLLLAVAVSLWSAVQAATNLQPGTLKQLVELERKYFGSSFDADSDQSRAERIEELLFGKAVAGDPEQRIKNLATDPYPHITALENAILGQSFCGQQLSVRLSRMENKAFGSQSANPDMSERTDALEQYAQNTLHKSSIEVDSEADTGSVAQTQAQSEQADYPRINTLEQAILGESFPGQPLADRLGRMESKAFGSSSSNPDLSARTDALEQYAEKKLHKKPFAEEQRREAANAGPQQGSGLPKQLLSMVGSTLLGMGGLGPAFIPAFGGVRMRPRQAEQQPDAPAPVRQEDPLVYDSAPPPPDAKLLTKVGWCEVQLFGHTFPDMHLPERLEQLNRQLNFSQGKSGIGLMDDLSALIKAVQAQGQAARSIGSRSQPAPR